VLWVAGSYALVARASILFSFQASRITPIYPAAGLALAAAFLLGRVGLLGVWLGAVLTVTISGLSQGHLSWPALGHALPMGLVGGTGAMAGAWAGAHLVRRFSHGPFPLESGWNVLVLLTMGALVAGAVSPTLGVLSLTLGGIIPWALFGISWLTWWVGDASGVVVAAPLIMAWLRREPQDENRPLGLEALVLAAATGLVCYGIFFRELNYEYVLLPLILWAAFRFRVRGAMSAAGVITIFATLGTSQGHGPFARGTATSSLLHLHMFLAVIMSCALLLAGLLAERSKGERSLAEREAELSSYIANSPVGIFISDLGGLIRLVNPAVMRQTGYQEQELLGMSVVDLVGPAWRESWALALQNLWGQGQAALELGHLRKDGGEGFWSVEAVRLSPTRLLGFVSDISQRKRQEEEKAKLEAQFQQVQKMESLGMLAGGIAHDMNNVLGAILSLASAHLCTQPDGTPLYRALETICKATERGGKMVKGLLSFARQTPCEENPLDLNTILKEQVSLLERTTLAKVRLQLELEPGLRPVLGDAGALTNAFMNLCVNAVDAMPDNGSLILRTRNAASGWVEVEVEDTGTGMSTEVLAKAMDPFFTTKEVGKGTGLGLPSVFSTVKAHRGQMEIQSEPGRGTRIRMRFPACEVEGQPANATGTAETVAMVRSLRVLVVDDDELIQDSMRVILEGLGHRVALAGSGEEALALVEAGENPDLIILDINMPGLGGVAALPTLRGLRPKVPVLLCTGRSDQTALTLASEQNGVTLLTKPFGIRELRKHLETIGLG